MPRTDHPNEVLMRGGEDIESPIIGIRPSTRVVESPTADASLLKNPPQTVQVRVVLLNQLDIEPGRLLNRDASFSIEVTSRKSHLLRGTPVVYGVAGSPFRFDRPDRTTALSVYPASASELLE